MTNATLFSIEDFHLEPDSIMVDLVKNDTFRKVKVPRGLYEQWLRFDDRLNTQMNYSGEGGEPIEELGIMSLEEMWNGSRNAIEKDLYDYIITKMVDQRRMLHMAFKDIESILLTHTI